VLNAGLNWVLIPQFGILGTVYSTLISVVIGTILAYLIGSRYLRYPAPGIDAIKIIVGVAAMTLISGLALPLQGATGLAVQLILAGSSYGIALIAMDAMGLRSRVVEAYAVFVANRRTPS
jgi:O-antigen/teichoic acid export membrane protein